MQTHNLPVSDGTRPVSRIGVWGYGALLDAPPAEVERELTYTRTVFTAAGAETVMRMLCDYDSRGRLQFPTGLAPRVARRLESMGYEAVVTDHRRFGPRHTPSANVTARAAGHQRDFYRAVAKNPLGGIEVRGTEEMVRRVAHWCILAADLRAFRGRHWPAANPPSKENGNRVIGRQTRFGQAGNG